MVRAPPASCAPPNACRSCSASARGATAQYRPRRGRRAAAPGGGRARYRRRASRGAAARAAGCAAGCSICPGWTTPPLALAAPLSLACPRRPPRVRRPGRAHPARSRRDGGGARPWRGAMTRPTTPPTSRGSRPTAPRGQGEQRPAQPCAWATPARTAAVGHRRPPAARSGWASAAGGCGRAVARMTGCCRRRTTTAAGDGGGSHPV